MDSSKIISIAAIIISIASIYLLIEFNSILQSNIGKLEDHLREQLDISKSQDSDLKSIHILVNEQGVKIEQLESNLTMIKNADRSDILELQHKITDIQANMTNMNNTTESLFKKVVILEEKIGETTTLVPNQSNYEPITLTDENNKNWTSHYIKQRLYDATITSVCNSPPPHCFVHLSKFNTIAGTAIAIDTIGSSDSGYYFIGYSDQYVGPKNGLVTISGKFLKKDELTLAGFGKNSTLSVFVLGENPDIIINKTPLLDYNDPTGVWFSKKIQFKITPGEIFRVGFGGTNSWNQDYKMYDSWAGVSVIAETNR